MYTDVYVALDYPSKETHWEGYNKIREYLKGEFPEFASFNVIAREANYGSARNMRELRNDILKNMIDSYGQMMTANSLQILLNIWIKP